MTELSNLGSNHEADKQSFVVEPARAEDATGIFDVQRLTWMSTYPNPELGITAEDIRIHIEGEHSELIPPKIGRWRKGIEATGPQRATFVVRDEDKVIGYTAPAIINGQRRIGAIYVLPDKQGKGLGQKLLDKAIEWQGRDEDIFLHVASYNQSAIDFYTSNGFEKTGRPVGPEDSHSVNGKEIPEIEMVLRPSGLFAFTID